MTDTKKTSIKEHDLQFDKLAEVKDQDNSDLDKDQFMEKVAKLDQNMKGNGIGVVQR